MVEKIYYNKLNLNFLNNASNLKNHTYKNRSSNIENPEIEIELFSESARVSLPYIDGIFGPEAIEGGYFGGNQGSLIYNFDTFIKNRKVWEIVQKYYPESDAEDLELLFYRMNRCGCGYIAAINTLLFQQCYDRGIQDFDSIFGFPFFGSQGYCYDYLFLDFFLYYAKYEKGYETIEDVYGNAAEEREVTDNQDGALSDDDFKRIGMDGTYVDGVAKIFADYLKSKGINIKVYDGIPMSDEDKRKYIEDYEAKGGVWLGDIDDVPDYYPIEDAIDIVLKDTSLVMTISANNYPLYYPYDKDGNGLLDDVANSDVGAHAMTVVGITDDHTKAIVSSWGKEYLVDIDDIIDYAVYDYSEYYGTESSLEG